MRTKTPEPLVLRYIILCIALAAVACQDPPAPTLPTPTQEADQPKPDNNPGDDPTWSPRALATQWTHFSRMPLPPDKRSQLSKTIEDRWKGKKLTWTAKVYMERCDRRTRSCFVDPFKRTHLRTKEIISLRGFRPKLVFDQTSWVKLVRACKKAGHCVATFDATVETIITQIDSPLVFIMKKGHIHKIRPQPKEEFWLYDTKNTWSDQVP